MSVSFCREIAECRRKLREIPDGHLLFLDETALRVSEAPTHTIVLPGERPFVIAEDTSSYAKRYDMIACCTSKETLPPIIFAPNDHERRNGINAEMLHSYIRDFLAQAIGALDRYPLSDTLAIDRASIHNADKMLREFHDWGCQELVEIVKIPSMSAKRLSPFDNSIFHDWKERIRQHAPITSENIRQLMNDEWVNLPSSYLEAHYQHCLLKPRQRLYGDCPLPSVHRH